MTSIVTGAFFGFVLLGFTLWAIEKSTPSASSRTRATRYRQLRYGDDTITPSRVTRFAEVNESIGTEEAAYASSVARRALAGDRRAQSIIVGLIAESYFEAYASAKTEESQSKDGIKESE